MDKITKDDIASGYNNPNWNGGGYLGARQNALGQPQTIARADTRLLREVNAAAWTPEQFFAWLNSQQGRWYGDAWFGGIAPEIRERDIRATITLKGLGV